MRSISNHELAKLINMTPQSFSRLFKLRTGKTYIAYLNEVRITEACRKIMFQEISMNEIAYACGFNHVQHFNRVFKKLKGVSPSIYKNKIARSSGKS
jgi:transcriptional regulator GlxA family with amidase domain